jgi:hypothetical protein
MFSNHFQGFLTYFMSLRSDEVYEREVDDVEAREVFDEELD